MSKMSLTNEKRKKFGALNLKETDETDARQIKQLLHMIHER
jgi:hypothetical protein